MTGRARAVDDGAVDRAVAGLVEFLETGAVPGGLLAPAVAGDLSLPLRRVRTRTAADLVRVRTEGHPGRGRVHVERVDPTPSGFVLQFEERWSNAGEQWYARELIRADLTGGVITELAVYCTGDWDRAHQEAYAAAVGDGDRP